MNAAELLGSVLPDERTAAFVTSAISLRYLCGTEISGAIAIISREMRFLFVGTDGVSADGFTVIRLKKLSQILDIDRKSVV